MTTKPMHRKIGALWAGTNADGSLRLSGEIAIDGAALGVLVFPNRQHKPGDKRPPFIVYAREDEASRVEDWINDMQEMR